jgi:Predicted metal-binding, possibly nucleic acid-binding protein
LQPFVVQLTSLAPGTNHFAWHAGAEFFETFGNVEILDADLEVTARVVSHGLTAEVSCDIAGTVTVACDRCLEDLVLPVKTSFEESYTPESDELDLGQDVYDYVCISLPLQRVHPDGECNQETTKYLSI